MTSSENLASIEPWTFRSTFSDPWITEAFARDTETLTKALQKSLSNNNSSTETLTSDTISPFLNIFKPETTPTPTVSGLSGSIPETAPKRQRNAIPTTSGKVSKRKCRASKRSQTKFITVDPANFRQMVQRMTGVRFVGSQVPVSPILKPEPQRPGSRLRGGGSCLLPTLDTSAFLLDHHHQQMVVGPNSSAGVGLTGPGPLVFPPPVVAGFDFDTFARVPTLESWKVL